MKKIFVLMIFILLIGSCLVYLRPSHDDSGAELSARSQEFIASRRQSGASDWNEISFATVSPAVLGSQSYATGCFSLDFPWPVVEQRTEDDVDRCVFRGRVRENGMQVTIRQEPHSQPITEYPGVMTRIREPKQYTRETISLTLPGEVLVFYDKDSSVLFWQRDSVMRIVALSGVSKDKRTVETLEQIAKKL